MEAIAFWRIWLPLRSVDKRLAQTLYKANYFSLKTEVKVGLHGHVHTSLLQIKMSEQPYHLKIVNESNNPWTFYVYQKAPDIISDEVFSLAWFASPYKVRVGNYVEFTWAIKYQFVWSATGEVRPEVVFRTGGSKDCKPSGKNHTKFEAGQAPGLSEPFQAPQEGSLYIENEDNVPVKKFAVGIGMSGNGTFVRQAQPNLTFNFTPTPTYWVAAGEEEQVGTILNIKTVTRTAQVIFPRNEYSMVATLGSDNKWEIKSAGFLGATEFDAAGRGGSTTTTTTNTRTTTYNCCALI